MLSTNAADRSKVSRHCGFCFIKIPAEQVKLCAQCHRRAYCGRECQKKDWTPKTGFHDGIGQGHKNWCGIHSCEEDIDWEISPLGYNIFAKRLIPLHSRVIIEGYEPSNEYGQKNYNPLRRSSNHIHPSCDINVISVFDDEFKVNIIYSTKEILPGQQLFENPVAFNCRYDRIENPDIGSHLYYPDSKPYIDSFADARRIKEQRGKYYYCPSNCYCRDPKIDALTKKSKSIFQQIEFKQEKGYNSIEEADADLKSVQKLLESHDECHFPAISKCNLLRLGTTVALLRKSTIEIAVKLLEEIVDIYESILHPRRQMTNHFKFRLSFPSSAVMYCSLDKLYAPETESSDMFQVLEVNADTQISEKEPLQLVPLLIKSGRHCGFCLIAIPVGEVKKCGQCRRRAYCGRKCQAADWLCAPNESDAGNQRKGQGHKKWCGQTYGEEDIDWEVTSLCRKNGFKYGIVARTKIRSGTRIIVEGFGGNRVFCPHDEKVLISRCGLVNHSCYPNAARVVDFDANVMVMIVYATRNIEAGEDITMSYEVFKAEMCSHRTNQNPYSQLERNEPVLASLESSQLEKVKHRRGAKGKASVELELNAEQVRHCGYCIKRIYPPNIILCGKCHRRAYCSGKCQKYDWSSKRGLETCLKGQGHEDWCGIPYGEEDIDWEITFYIPGKGRGVVSKRFIPVGYRLMVEGFARKAIGKKIEELQRSYRHNHSCNANALHTIDYEFNVMIGYSKHDIQLGEEICTNYYGFNEFYEKEFLINENSSKRAESYDDIRMMLQLEHNITCLPNCFCLDPEIEQLVVEGKKTFRSLKILKKSKRPSITYSVADAEEELSKIQELLKNSEKIQIAPTEKARLLVLASASAVQGKSTLNLAKSYAEEAYELTSAVWHPNSNEAKKVKMLAKQA